MSYLNLAIFQEGDDHKKKHYFDLYAFTLSNISIVLD